MHALPSTSHHAPPGTETESRSLGDIFWRQRWLVLAVAATVIALIGAYTAFKRPVYEAATTLTIEEEKGGLELLSELSPLGGSGGNVIETDMLVLRSRQIAEAVADSLVLHVQLQKPNLPRSRVFAQVSAGREVVPGTYEMTLRDDGSYSVEATDGPAAGGKPLVVQPGSPFRLGGATLALRPELRRSPPATIRVKVRPYRDAVAALRSDVSITRLDRMAQVLSIGYESTDPEFAAGVPNAAAASFMRYKASGSKLSSRSTVGFLREQVANYQGDLRSAETRLRAFRERAQVISVTDQASEQVKRLAELQAKRDEVNSERESLAALLERVQAEPAGDGAPSPYRALASFPTLLSNRAVQDILQSLTDLENRRSELLVRRTPTNADVQGFDQRIRELESQLFQTARSYLGSLNSQAASLENGLARFDRQLATIPATEVEFARLLREQKVLEEIYTLLQTRLKEAEIQEAVEPGNVRVIDSALVPLEPVAPRPLVNMILGTVLGLLLGAGTGFVRETMDSKIRSREDVEGAAPGVSILGTIPRIVAQAANGNGNGRKASRLIQTPVSNGERLVTRRDPRSPVSEAYRAMRTSITFASVDRAPQVMVVTSAMPGDGKSTSSSNLAITLAQQGTRTLLVDADLRKGLLHEVFGCTQTPGLTNVLHAGMPLAEAVRTVDAGGSGVQLDFLPSGVFPPNPAELLGSARMQKLMEQLRGEYEVVIFDAPPLNLVTDGAILGRLADTTILVARAGVTDRRALQHAVTQLRQLQVPFGGIVLNDLDARAPGYYGHGVYGYHSDN